MALIGQADEPDAAKRAQGRMAPIGQADEPDAAKRAQGRHGAHRSDG